MWLNPGCGLLPEVGSEPGTLLSSSSARYATRSFTPALEHSQAHMGPFIDYTHMARPPMNYQPQNHMARPSLDYYSQNHMTKAYTNLYGRPSTDATAPHPFRAQPHQVRFGHLGHLHFGLAPAESAQWTIQLGAPCFCNAPLSTMYAPLLRHTTACSFGEFVSW